MYYFFLILSVKKKKKNRSILIFKVWKLNTTLFTNFAVLSTKKKKRILNFDELSKYTLNDTSYFVVYENINRRDLKHKLGTYISITYIF